jgi:transcriptional regulator with XRE-family HTH domain
MPRNASRSPETNAAALLGAELARLRVAAGFTVQATFAAELGYDRSVIAKAESGDRPPSDPVFTAWMDACGVTPEVRGMLERQLILARNAAGVGPNPQWALWWFEVEGKAGFLRLWAPVLVPGLMQVDEYAHAVFLAAGMGDDEATEHVAARLARQVILDSPDGTRATAILDESVLYRQVGSPTVMVKQLEHLLAISRRKNVMIQIVRSASYYGGLDAPFEIASGPEIPDTLVMVAIEDQTTDNQAMVDKAAALFEAIRGRALTTEDSRAGMMEALEHWKRQQQ